MAFFVGQKVVCVETWSRMGLGIGTEVGPVCGETYTIRACGKGLHLQEPDTIHVYLNEIKNPIFNYRQGVYEVAFRASRFRPLVEKKTDIAIFTALLDPANHKKLENV